MRYPASEKLEIIRIVDRSHLPAKVTLDKLGVSRPVATGHDLSEPVAPTEDTPKIEKQAQEEGVELKQLREKVMSLEIDKRVRDGLLDQMKDDRKELLSQLQNHIETMTSQSRVIGQL